MMKFCILSMVGRNFRRNFFDKKVILGMIGEYSLLYTYSFTDALHYYGFTTSEEKEALIYLLEKSLIIDSRLKASFGSKKTEKKFINDIAYIIKETQKKFVIRSKSQERWEVEALEWMKLNQTEILVSLKRIGVIDTILPTENSTDAFCIFGTTGPAIIKSLEYGYVLTRSMLKTKSVILLGGERYITKNVDGTEEELSRIAHTLGLSDYTYLTETTLLEYYYTHSLLNTPTMPVFSIYTPRGNRPRPTTETTLLALIEWLKSHPEIKHITFISNQPYVKYQKAKVDLVFQEHSVNICYEVVGIASAEENELRLIVEGLGALGSYLWASTPMMLSKMGIKNLNKKLIDLYVDTPFMYDILTTYFTCLE